MAQSPEKLRSLYRSLLRALPPRPAPPLASPRSPLHQRLRSHFSDSSDSTASAAASASTPTPKANAVEIKRADVAVALAQAEQYAAYLRAQRTYVALLERYNPGMGMDEEERVRLTARRVGMDLPVEFGGQGK